MTEPTLSLVIPAYNEADRIGGLLESLRGEATELDEIIVVDNNSTDSTAAVVHAYSGLIPGLRIVREPRRGLINARNTGFDAASSELIGRIDADARATPGWARAIRAYFSDAPPNVGAGTGFFDQYDMPLQWIHRALVRASLANAVRHGGDLPAILGANMVIRRSTWENIRPIVSHDRHIFEDLDLSICVKQIGQRNVVIPGMHISTSGRRMLTGIASYREFTECLPNTFARRGMHKEAAAARMTVRRIRLQHLIFLAPSRAWDPERRRYSIRKLFSAHTDRVLPV